MNGLVVCPAAAADGTSVLSDSVRPHGLQPSRLLRPWDFPGKSTGVGCHCLLWWFTLPFQFKSEFGDKEFVIWATVSSHSCFCWLHRASPSLAAKHIINLILVFTIFWCPWLCCCKRVFAKTSVFSWQNSSSFCTASFGTPRPNLPVTPGISWLPTFAFQSPMMKRTFVVVVVVSRRSCKSS